MTRDQLHLWPSETTLLGPRVTNQFSGLRSSRLVSEPHRAPDEGHARAIGGPETRLRGFSVIQRDHCHPSRIQFGASGFVGNRHVLLSGPLAARRGETVPKPR